VVIDVSVETALLRRLFGVATVVVRQHGDRTDAARVRRAAQVWRIGLFDGVVADRERPVVCGWIDDVGAMLIHRPPSSRAPATRRWRASPAPAHRSSWCPKTGSSTNSADTPRARTQPE
jgi:hypothetical protein